MGSSKKHKEKDKDRSEKRHKHKEKDREKEKKHKHRRHRSRSKERDTDRDGTSGSTTTTATGMTGTTSASHSSKERSSRKRKSRASPSVEDATSRRSPERSSASKSQGKSAEALSIEETNKIRARLGLPSLDESSSSSRKESSLEPTKLTVQGGVRLEDGDVHKPAVNLREQRKANEIKEKLALIKEKRQMNKKLKKVKALADDSDGDSEDAHAWIEKSRKKQEEKAKADKKAKMLAEMDEEFGIGTLVQDQMRREKQQMYTSRHISGLTVEHSKGAFKEGKDIILTLKDGDILGDENDVLVNYNILDDERATKNIELKKKKPAYRAYEEDQYDEFGVFKPRAILDKYDDEIEGATVESFTLDGMGGSSVAQEERLQRMRASLQQQAVTLHTSAPRLATEYYTHEEMDSFKKPKRKKKIKRRLRGKFTVDELMPDKKSKLPEDHGSRRGKYQSDGEEEIAPVEVLAENGNAVEVFEYNQGATAMEVVLPNIDQGAIQKPDLTRNYLGPVIEDEAEAELQMVLHKARKLKLKKQRKQKAPSVEEKVTVELSQIKNEPMSPTASAPVGTSFTSPAAASSIVLNSTSEFCRQLGDIPTYGTSGNREEDEEEDAMDYEQEARETYARDEEDDEGVQAWSTVNLDKGEEEEVEADEQAPVLEEEPTVQIGMAGALQLAVNKGYLENEPKKKGTQQRSKIESQNFQVEEKNYNDIDAKYSKHDRFRGPITDFKEKDMYKPDVKLEYIDDTGRLLNRKEAFRQLSHRFHGKGSGKMKTEKREKKWQEEEAMKKMSSTDTPLGTVAMMQAKQRQMQMPYVFLSGGAKALATNPITK